MWETGNRLGGRSTLFQWYCVGHAVKKGAVGRRGGRAYGCVRQRYRQPSNGNGTLRGRLGRWADIRVVENRRWWRLGGWLDALVVENGCFHEATILRARENTIIRVCQGDTSSRVWQENTISRVCQGDTSSPVCQENTISRVCQGTMRWCVRRSSRETERDGGAARPRRR